MARVGRLFFSSTQCWPPRPGNQPELGAQIEQVRIARILAQRALRRDPPADRQRSRRTSCRVGGLEDVVREVVATVIVQGDVDGCPPRDVTLLCPANPRGLRRPRRTIRRSVNVLPSSVDTRRRPSSVPTARAAPCGAAIPRWPSCRCNTARRRRSIGCFRPACGPSAAASSDPRRWSCRRDPRR